MGEMADLLIEQMEMDGMYFDNCMYEETTDSYISARPRKIIKCKFCNKQPLIWGKNDGRWILHEQDGNIHDCPENPLVCTLLKKLMDKKKNMMPQLLPIPSWDETYMHDVYWWARRSKDPMTKYGAVLIYPDEHDPISHAYNGFARKIDESIPERWERPEKYQWVTHAESNAILNCARTGRSTKGTVMYVQGMPCTDCANDIVQAKVSEVVIHKQWQDFLYKFAYDKWKESAKRSIQKFNEAGINVRLFDKVLGVQGVLDGKIIDV